MRPDSASTSGTVGFMRPLYGRGIGWPMAVGRPGWPDSCQVLLTFKLKTLRKMESGIPRPASRSQPVSQDLTPLLQLEQLRLLYDYLPISQLVTVVNALVFVAVQSLVIGWSTLIGWLYAVCMV